MKFGRNPIKNDIVRVTTTADGQTDGQAKNNRTPPTRWRSPKNKRHDQTRFTLNMVTISAPFTIGHAYFTLHVSRIAGGSELCNKHPGKRDFYRV